jgi:hypothetical protein
MWNGPLNGTCAKCGWGARALVGRSQPNSEIILHDEAERRLTADFQAFQPVGPPPGEAGAEDETHLYEVWSKSHAQHRVLWDAWRDALSYDLVWDDANEQELSKWKLEYNQILDAVARDLPRMPVTAPRADPTPPDLERDDRDVDPTVASVAGAVKWLTVLVAFGLFTYYFGPAIRPLLSRGAK